MPLGSAGKPSFPEDASNKCSKSPVQPNKPSETFDWTSFTCLRRPRPSFYIQRDRFSSTSKPRSQNEDKDIHPHTGMCICACEAAESLHSLISRLCDAGLYAHASRLDRHLPQILSVPRSLPASLSAEVPRSGVSGLPLFWTLG